MLYVNIYEIKFIIMYVISEIFLIVTVVIIIKSFSPLHL